MGAEEQLYVLHPGTGTVVAASECRLIRLTEQQAARYGDAAMDRWTAVLLERVAGPVDDPAEAVWFDVSAVRDHFDMRDPGRESGPGVDGLTDEQVRGAARAALASDRLWEVYHEVLSAAVAAVRGGRG